jgi:uncharacterized membrane protein YdjX (TVP38/TMEM64 family)
MSSGRSALIVRILVLVLIFALIIGLFLIRDQLQKLEKYGYLGIFLISIAANATIFIPIPGIALTTAMGAIFNPMWVALASGFGAAIGELTGYAAGYSSQDLVKKRELFNRLINWMKAHPRWIMVLIGILAFIPNPLLDVAGMASGVLKVPTWRFFLPCLIGKIMKSLVFSYIGHTSVDWLNL